MFEVLSTNGDTHLGGDDFDQVIIDFLADAVQERERRPRPAQRPNGPATPEGSRRESQS
ncbi:MAG: Hsp70 family protein [Hymenobacter sp.]